ncbi:MAG: dipeptide epimerase [Candidatus Thermoplasmatota archaeon]|nr:dipeptide epimerase [Candidatus Thermoplasmatota archaeon]MBU1940674.1 dipeptide epimerase [Candidatus Thermoplasmatota archaeon]
MRIISATAIPIELELKEPFSVANETVETASNVFFKLETDTNLIGWGCATPDSVTSETEATVLHAFNTVLKNLLIGKEPTRIHLLNEIIEDQLKGNPSAKAGINMALYDLLGKNANTPIYQILGGYRDKIETSVTVGLNPADVMIEHAKDIVSQGFRCLKVKCGMDPDKDIETVLGIRAAVGQNIKIRLDANEGYTLEKALRVIETLEKLGADIELLEQPTPAKYLFALKEVTAQCTVPIMADETAFTLRDSLKLIKMEIADMINIKLMKIGGITNSIKANIFAELAEIPVMIGCMNESMGAMAAGVHFACAFKNVLYADLDSALDFKHDVVRGGAEYKDGYVIPSEAPGLGIEVDL